MAKSEYVQCELESLETGALTTCWLDRPGAFKVGSVISLRGETEKWTVLSRGSVRKPKSSLNTDWVVGGLKGRKR